MAVLDWRLPLVRGEGRVMQTIEPRVQLIGSPAGGNPNDIPNEDSVSFEFTDGNLFSRNRFAGHDRIESGSRLNYGVKAGLIGLGGGSSEIEIGQSFRINDNSAFQPGTGLEDRMSDIVGRVTIMPTAGFAYTFRYRVDVNGPRLNRHEHQLRFDGESYRLDLNYVSVPRIGNGVAVGNTEEISFDGGVDISEYWEMLAGYRGDFSGDGAIRLEGGVRYLDECFDFELGAARDFTSDRDDEASTSFFVRVRLRGLN
jgi:LPS-assembly protein